jgi:hypothetical protein
MTAPFKSPVTLCFERMLGAGKYSAAATDLQKSCKSCILTMHLSQSRPSRHKGTRPQAKPRKQTNEALSHLDGELGGRTARTVSNETCHALSRSDPGPNRPLPVRRADSDNPFIRILQDEALYK